MCEDFAPRNGATRASGQRGAKRARGKSTGSRRGRGNCVKILLPGTELQGLAGRGEQTAPGESRPARPPAKLHIPAGNCVKILLPETKPQGLARSGEQTGRPVAGEIAYSGRELCEDFAPRNGGIRPSEERGANRPASLHQWPSRLSCSPFCGPASRVYPSLHQINCIVSQFIQRNFYK